MELDINKNGNVIVNEENVMKIMYMIVLNQISNVRYYITNVIKINPTSYYSTVNSIEKKYPRFYNYYITNLDNNKRIMKEKIKNVLLYIGTFMNYGIELEDGSFRPFDLFDFYNLRCNYFDNLNRNEISIIADELTRDNIKYGSNIDIFELRKTLSLVLGRSPGSYSREMLDEEVYNKKELKEEEIYKLLSFMKENNIPLNERNYEIGKKKMYLQRENNNDIFKLELPFDTEVKKVQKNRSR